MCDGFEVGWLGVGSVFVFGVCDFKIFVVV